MLHSMARRTSAAKRQAPAFDARDRDALLEAGNRVLLEGLGVDNALEFLRLIGGGRRRVEADRRGGAGGTGGAAPADMRRPPRPLRTPRVAAGSLPKLPPPPP